MLQPAKRHAYAQSGDNVFAPVERELIFDIVRFSAYFPNEIFYLFVLIDNRYLLVSPVFVGYDRL